MTDENKRVVVLNAHTYPFKLDIDKVDDLVYIYNKWNGDPKIGDAVHKIQSRWDELRREYHEAVEKRYDVLKSMIGGFYKMRITKPNSTYEETRYIFLYNVLLGNSMMFYLEANPDYDQYWCGMKDASMQFSDENLSKEIVFVKITEDKFLQTAHNGIGAMLAHRQQKMNEESPKYDAKWDI